MCMRINGVVSSQIKVFPCLADPQEEPQEASSCGLASILPACVPPHPFVCTCVRF